MVDRLIIMRNTFVFICITAIVHVTFFCCCASLANNKKQTSNKTILNDKTVKGTNEECIPDEPERTISINGVLWNIGLDEKITVPPGPLTLCEDVNGGLIGEGGGTSVVSWYQGSVSGEYVDDSDGKNRIKVTIKTSALTTMPEGVRKQYLFSVSELPKTIVEDNVTITISLVKNSEKKDSE